MHPYHGIRHDEGNHPMEESYKEALLMIAEGIKYRGMPDSSRLARGEATHILSERVVVKEKVSSRSISSGDDF
jgi:hypothetical protein